jgi:hypothetical protein
VIRLLDKLAPPRGNHQVAGRSGLCNLVSPGGRYMCDRPLEHFGVVHWEARDGGEPRCWGGERCVYCGQFAYQAAWGCHCCGMAAPEDEAGPPKVRTHGPMSGRDPESAADRAQRKAADTLEYLGASAADLAALAGDDGEVMPGDAVPPKQRSELRPELVTPPWPEPARAFSGEQVQAGAGRPFGETYDEWRVRTDAAVLKRVSEPPDRVDQLAARYDTDLPRPRTSSVATGEARDAHAPGDLAQAGPGQSYLADCCDDVPPDALHSHVHELECADARCHGCAPAPQELARRGSVTERLPVANEGHPAPRQQELAGSVPVERADRGAPGAGDGPGQHDLSRPAVLGGASGVGTGGERTADPVTAGPGQDDLSRPGTPEAAATAAHAGMSADRSDYGPGEGHHDMPLTGDSDGRIAEAPGLAATPGAHAGPGQPPYWEGEGRVREWHQPDMSAFRHAVRVSADADAEELPRSGADPGGPCAGPGQAGDAAESEPAPVDHPDQPRQEAGAQ